MVRPSTVPRWWSWIYALRDEMVIVGEFWAHSNVQYVFPRSLEDIGKIKINHIKTLSKYPEYKIKSMSNDAVISKLDKQQTSIQVRI